MVPVAMQFLCSARPCDDLSIGRVGRGFRPERSCRATVYCLKMKAEKPAKGALPWACPAARKCLWSGMSNLLGFQTRGVPPADPVDAGRSIVRVTTHCQGRTCGWVGCSHCPPWGPAQPPAGEQHLAVHDLALWHLSSSLGPGK